MRYLLDTHVLVWWYLDAPQLRAKYREILEGIPASGERVGLSAMSLWEIAKLVEIGRLAFDVAVDRALADIESDPAIEVLPITARIAFESTRLGAGFPRDPVDQTIAATARIHELTLLSVDRPIRGSKVVPVL